MASFAVIHGKSHGQMTNTAEFALQYSIHVKMLRGLLLDIKDIGMTVAAVEPLRVHLM